ncbi:ExbD/TolR family protein [Xanthocytophaga flava]|uniref:ExbD/TolR family protein n=1 Tax=Xanthocytophaga flava TaxID=3048013 RepID=UPI0028D1E821|nr:biopolymer transporter ExbD [Xanthocytophaga flavus]MDJ1470060.1 biopolymer transporter ExbD [Xanthocytophaga flavus]
MADVDTGGKGGGKKKGAKKASTKVDMTPMVDLAFLLVTFFMLTTTLSKPNTMSLNMPEKPKPNDPPPPKVDERVTTTIVLDKNNRIFYYKGVETPEVFTTDYSAEGFRKVAVEMVAKGKSLQKDAVFIIKPTAEASYKNVVDILDEMKITDAKVYAIQQLYPQDKEIIEKYKKEHNITD